MPGHLLPPEERLQLEKLANETGDAGLLRRLRDLLLYDEGQPTRDVAVEAGLSRGRSRYWRRQFQRQGVPAITHDNKPVNLVTEPASPAPPEAKEAEEPEGEGRLFPAATGEPVEALPVEARPAGLAEFAAAANTLSSPGVLPDD